MADRRVDTFSFIGGVQDVGKGMGTVSVICAYKLKRHVVYVAPPPARLRDLDCFTHFELLAELLGELVADDGRREGFPLKRNPAGGGVYRPQSSWETLFPFRG